MTFNCCLSVVSRWLVFVKLLLNLFLKSKNNMWDWLMTNGKICIQTCPIKDAEFNASLVFRHQSKSVHREACQRSDRKISFAKCLSKRFSQNLKENLVLLWKNLNEFWIVFFHSDIYLQIRISFKYRTKKMMHGYFLSFFIDSTWPIDILGLWKMYFSDHMLHLGSFFIVTHWGKSFYYRRLRF